MYCHGDIILCLSKLRIIDRDSIKIKGILKIEFNATVDKNKLDINLDNLK
jgi:hypothetical protein